MSQPGYCDRWSRVPKAPVGAYEGREHPPVPRVNPRNRWTRDSPRQVHTPRRDAGCTLRAHSAPGRGGLTQPHEPDACRPSCLPALTRQLPVPAPTRRSPGSAKTREMSGDRPRLPRSTEIDCISPPTRSRGRGQLRTQTSTFYQIWSLCRKSQKLAQFIAQFRPRGQSTPRGRTFGLVARPHGHSPKSPKLTQMFPNFDDPRCVGIVTTSQIHRA